MENQIDLNPIITAIKNELAKQGLNIPPSPLPEIKKQLTALYDLLQENRKTLYKGWEVLLLLAPLFHYRDADE